MYNTVYMDESGYTGHDLMNKDQKFQSLSCLSIPETEALKLVENFFPSRRFAELKYSQLSRRKSHWKSLLEIQRILLNDFKAISYIVNKRYALALKLVDICIEPYYYARGFDFYANGRQIALASLIHSTGALFWGSDNYSNLLLSFQKMIKTKISADIEEFFKAFNNLPESDLKSDLIPLLEPDYAVFDSILAKESTTDLSDSMIIGLVSQLESQNKKHYQIIHDNTKNFDAYKAMVQKFISIKSKNEFDISNLCKVRFPLKLKHVEENNSHGNVGIQLADILAGGIIDGARTLVSTEKKNEYNELILSLYGSKNLLHLIPSIDFDEISDRFSNNQSNAFIDFIANHS